LDIKSFLDKHIGKPTELKKTIPSNEAYLFYTIVISNKGINGAVRAGFELENQNLIYKINDYKITSGKIISE
jgi:hypothetical protein